MPVVWVYIGRSLYISYSLCGLAFGWAVPLRIIPILQYIGLKTLCGKGGVYLACVGLLWLLLFNTPNWA